MLGVFDLLQAIWENQFYYLFGFLFLVFIILVVSCSQISIVMVYFQLCAEVPALAPTEERWPRFQLPSNALTISLCFFSPQDYRWWWRTFLVSGGSAFYVLIYAVFYFVNKVRKSSSWVLTSCSCYRGSQVRGHQ